MFLGMEDFDFAQILPSFDLTQILPEFAQIYPNLPKFAQISPQIAQIYPNFPKICPKKFARGSASPDPTTPIKSTE